MRTTLINSTMYIYCSYMQHYSIMNYPLLHVQEQ